jgi:hypothetical protein
MLRKNITVTLETTNYSGVQFDIFSSASYRACEVYVGSFFNIPSSKKYICSVPLPKDDFKLAIDKRHRPRFFAARIS